MRRKQGRGGAGSGGGHWGRLTPRDPPGPPTGCHQCRGTKAGSEYWGWEGRQGASLKQRLPWAESCSFRFPHPGLWIIFNHGSACSLQAGWQGCLPLGRCCQPIYCLHKHPPAGLHLAWGRGRSQEGGCMTWMGKGFSTPLGSTPKPTPTSTLSI